MDKPIGYRTLNRQELIAINDIKSLGASLIRFLKNLEDAPEVGGDTRWLAIAKTDIEKGLMCAVRSVAQPEI